MAFRNVFREKKRAVLVFASLFLGTMAFLATNAFADSMKLENYVKYYLYDLCQFRLRGGRNGCGADPEKQSFCGGNAAKDTGAGRHYRSAYSPV